MPTDVTWFDRQHCLFRGSLLKEVTLCDGVNLNSASGLFNGCSALEKVNGLENVKNFTQQSYFYNCSSLVSVTVPEGITYIPNETFCGCTSFTGIANWDSIKNNITSIGNYSFYKTAITSISLPSVTSIGNYSLAACPSLTVIDFDGAPLTSLGGCAMRDTPIVEINLPDTVKSIPSDCFNGCKQLKSFSVPRDCTEIAKYAFSGCSSLETFDMTGAKSLKSTSQNSFSGTKITSLIFPEGFEYFHSASGLSEVYFPNSTTYIGVLQACSFKEFVVPLGVTSLGSKMLDYCASVNTVTIHKGVTSINLSSNGSFFGSTKNAVKTVIYTGSETDAIVEQIKLAVPNAEIICADHCETYYGTHLWSGEAKMLDVDYFKAVQFADSCTRGDCNVVDVVDSMTINAMFTWKGYSCKTFGETFAMAQGFCIDNEAIAEYKKYVPSFEFGLIAAGNTTEDGKSEFAPDLNSDYCFPQGKLAHDYFDIKITGITANNAEKLIVFCAYVKAGDKVCYLDNNSTCQKLTGVSYNDVAKNTAQ